MQHEKKLEMLDDLQWIADTKGIPVDVFMEYSAFANQFRTKPREPIKMFEYWEKEDDYCLCCCNSALEAQIQFYKR